MTFGPDVVTLVRRTDGPVPGELGTYPQVETTTDLPGCHHRPLTFAETAELEFDIATEMWRTTIPIGEYSSDLRDAVLAAQPRDALRVDGEEYEIIGGARSHKDFSSLFKTTIISKKHIG